MVFKGVNWCFIILADLTENYGRNMVVTPSIGIIFNFLGRHLSDGTGSIRGNERLLSPVKGSTL